MSAATPTFAPRPWGDHVARTLRLAIPVMFSRLGILLLITVDVAMTGHAGGDQLAYYGLAVALHVPMLLIGIGLLTGTVILGAQADGAGRTSECGAVWRAGMGHAIGFGALALALCYTGEWFLRATGQSEALAQGGGRVLVIFGWGIPGMLLYAATTFFLESIKQPVPGLVTMLLANVVNAALNWLLIYGHAGVPAMGGEGAALATAVVRWLMFAGLASYVLLAVDRNRYGLHAAAAGAGVELGRRLRRLGLPIGLTHGLETSAFSSMTLFAGLQGEDQIAGFQIGMNSTALVFMGAVGLATAASVRVGNAVGRGDHAGVRPAGLVAVAVACVFALAAGALFCLAPRAIATIYASDTATLAAAVPALVVAGLVLAPDAAQAVFAGALRGAEDVWPATLMVLMSFWLLMVPLGFYFGVARGGGAPALMWAILAGCCLAALLLGLRFRYLAQRMQRTP